MSIRLPLDTVYSYVNTTEQGGGPTSVAGGVAKTFQIPQDTDNVVLKLTASVAGGGVSATFQTSDDGGTTYYDVARTSIVSAATNAKAEWLSIPVIGTGVSTTYVSGTVPSVGGQAASSIYGAIGSAEHNTLAQKSVSGLPILGKQNRVWLKYTAAITSIINESVYIKVNSQGK